MTLCPADKCSGCGACAAICPVGCISMREDAFGVSHPEIGPSCTECGLCAQTCPVLNPLPLHEPSKCYAGWNSDSEERRLSASGGVAALLARLYARKGLRHCLVGFFYGGGKKRKCKRLQRLQICAEPFFGRYLSRNKVPPEKRG
ncbi:MAG: 4Fe-4S dicluster domain-containing protein [Candidatus Cryptobacteroides sp.]